MFRIELIHHQAMTQNKQQVQCNDTSKCCFLVVHFSKILLGNVVRRLLFSKSRFVDIRFLSYSALRHYFFLLASVIIYLIVVFSKHTPFPCNFCS